MPRGQLSGQAATAPLFSLARNLGVCDARSSCEALCGGWCGEQKAKVSRPGVAGVLWDDEQVTGRQEAVGR
jgi:hypothetical protein